MVLKAVLDENSVEDKKEQEPGRASSFVVVQDLWSYNRSQDNARLGPLPVEHRHGP